VVLVMVAAGVVAIGLAVWPIARSRRRGAGAGEP
jgi:hypothetical protein